MLPPQLTLKLASYCLCQKLYKVFNILGLVFYETYMSINMYGVMSLAIKY